MTQEICSYCNDLKNKHNSNLCETLGKDHYGRIANVSSAYHFFKHLDHKLERYTINGSPTTDLYIPVLLREYYYKYTAGWIDYLDPKLGKLINQLFNLNTSLFKSIYGLEAITLAGMRMYESTDVHITINPDREQFDDYYFNSSVALIRSALKDYINPYRLHASRESLEHLKKFPVSKLALRVYEK